MWNLRNKNISPTKESHHRMCKENLTDGWFLRKRWIKEILLLLTGNFLGVLLWVVNHHWWWHGSGMVTIARSSFCSFVWNIFETLNLSHLSFSFFFLRDQLSSFHTLGWVQSGNLISLGLHDPDQIFDTICSIFWQNYFTFNFANCAKNFGSVDLILWKSSKWGVNDPIKPGSKMHCKHFLQ